MGKFLYSSYDPSLPQPIAFNGWRHHLGFIKETITDVSGNPNLLEKYINQINSIKGSVLDIYVGKLSCIEIQSEVGKFLTANKLASQHEFTEWIMSSANGYRKITISDNSSWTLTIGRYEGRYVHLHPSRYSQNSLRIKSSTLRTVVLYNLLKNNYDFSIDFENLNTIRIKYLKLSPVKSFTIKSQILKLIKIFDTI